MKEIKEILESKFSIDAQSAPDFSFDSLEAVRKKQNRKRSRLIIKIASLAALFVMTLAASLLYFFSENGDIINKSDLDKFANSNKLEQVTILYKSGNAEIEKDTAIPMVWVRK